MLEALQRVTDASLAFLPEHELLSELLGRITELLGADTAAILMLEPSVILPDASPLRRVAGIAGLDQAVPTHATLEAALAGAA